MSKRKIGRKMNAVTAQYGSGADNEVYQDHIHLSVDE